MFFSGVAAFFSVAVVLCAGGCGSLRTAEQAPGRNSGLLRSGGEYQSDTIGVDIFVIRITPQRYELLRQLWHEADELPIPTGLRRNLIGHGLRIGIQGSLLSSSLSQLINVTASMTGNDHAGVVNGMEEVSIADIQNDTGVSRQYRNLMPGMRAVLRPYDEPIDELPFFWQENGRTCGKTYKNALGLIAMTARPLNNGTVRFEIVPELEYGTVETKTRVQNMVVFKESGRPRRSFEELTVGLDILPGQWIIIGPSAVESIGIGRGFFARGTEGEEQKVIAVRLVDVRKRTPPVGATAPQTENRSPAAIPERN